MSKTTVKPTTAAKKTAATQTPAEKRERQRATDRCVQRVRKIEALAKACTDAQTEAFVSFGIMGMTYTLPGEQSRQLAALMLIAALDEHAKDKDAGPLPKELAWVREVAEGAKKKSPSMTGPKEEKAEGKKK